MLLLQVPGSSPWTSFSSIRVCTKTLNIFLLFERTVITAMKSIKKMQFEQIDKTYNDYQGFLIRKYKSFFGKYVFVMEQDSNTVKFYVGKGIFDSVAVGSKLTVGLLGKKLISIRPGFCNSVNE